MLHRTLLKSGHSEVAKHAGGDVATTAAAKKLIPGSAGYFNRADLGWVHIHRECNYRKTRLGMKAYNKDNMDIWAPWQQMSPMRHMEIAAPGMWFACGHIPWHQWGFWKWPATGKALLNWWTPFPVFGISYWIRYSKAGYSQKNRGAVFGD